MQFEPVAPPAQTPATHVSPEQQSLVDEHDCPTAWHAAVVHPAAKSAAPPRITIASKPRRTSEFFIAPRYPITDIALKPQ